VVKGIVVRAAAATGTTRAAALGRGHGAAMPPWSHPLLAGPISAGRALIAVALAAFVCLARVHVAAHLPLDIVGGAALGLAVAGLVRLILGHPDR
jgi:undecaprenyl-diphosphatase